MLDLDPLYLFYACAAIAAVLATEALYLAFHNTKDYRNRVNRRLEISSKETNREKVLVQLRRERGEAVEQVERIDIERHARGLEGSK